MSTDYIVASLPPLAFDQPAPISWDRFLSLMEPEGREPASPKWADIETQLRNAMSEARGGGEKYRRPAEGCSVYWKNRVLACFQEKDVAKRDEMLDRVWWDAAGELTPPASPLGECALAEERPVRRELRDAEAVLDFDAVGARVENLTIADGSTENYGGLISAYRRPYGG